MKTSRSEVFRLFDSGVIPYRIHMQTRMPYADVIKHLYQSGRLDQTPAKEIRPPKKIRKKRERG